MKRIKIIFVLALLGVLLIGCKSKEARVQEQLDLGSKYMAELDYESAIVALNKAIKLDPKNVDAYKMLAEVYEKSGRLDDARATLEKVLDLDDLSSENKDEINDRIKNLDFLVAISKLPGEYDEPTALELSNTGSNDIYYSIDTKDSRLVATDMKYTSPILLDEDGSYVVKAYTVDSSGNKHDSTEVKYTIKLSKEHVEKDSWESVGNIYRYRGKDGKIVIGWQQIDGSWYYFKENGDMATGFADINGVKYCFDEDGVMLTGWQQIGGKWYYLGDDGAAKSGSQSIGGKQYYFGEDGAMLTGWQQIDGKWYYITDSGEMSTGWQQIDGKWYYFASNGEMKTDQYIDGYYVGADGVRTAESTNNITASGENTDYKKLYRDVLTKFYTKHELEGRDDDNEWIRESGEAQYTLLDVTGDGKAELIVYVMPGITSIYGVKNGKISLLLGTYMDSGCSILNDNTIVTGTRISNTAAHGRPGNSGVWFECYRYNQQTGKFEMYKYGEAINPESDEYNADDGQYYDNLMSKVVMETFEGANIPVTPENIAKIK
ncbi:MAG: tetratricopeptide repeat protein [Lachnospiraceae bacterium oral taxon 082]|nr:tetratricopeptide repeat protein [Lachnospiraceae bacterium oral taxon 082]